MISVDPASPVPTYEQIRLGIVADIRSGALTPGTRLPTVRRLAIDLGLAPNTVARAYRELEQDQVVETRGRQGTFVPAPSGLTERQAFTATAEYVERLRGLGIELDQAFVLVAAGFRAG